MRINQIQMNGFKSFADKTVLEMHSGITAVVGPNGCGKSNVVDALRWVLGEQSAKNLRGEKMEEVIFNGTERKKQKGMAEVSITLSGVSRELPSGMPIDEIRVSRRLFRSGESEYLINNQQCRLRDIRDIFLDTGLELRSYAILEQGKVGDIINSKPVDRRFLIEEAAGVVKYKVRKQEAVSKLESARNNLQRIKDIVSEVKRQMNAIERQAKKAERYKAMAGEAKELELALSSREFQKLSSEKNEANTGRQELKMQEAVAAALLERKDSELEKERLVMAEKESEIEKSQQGIYVIEKSITELEGKIELFRNEHSNLEARRERNNTREKELKDRETILIREIEQLKGQEGILRQEVEEFNSRLQTGNTEFKAVEESLLDIEEALDEKRRELFRQAEELAHAKNEFSNLERELESQKRNETRADEDIKVLEREVANAQNSIDAMHVHVEDQACEVELSKLARTRMTNELQESRKDLKQVEDEYRSAKEDLVAASSRLKSLKEMDDGLAGYRKGIKKLIKGSGSEHNLKIKGLVADNIQVPSEYETAIEAVLGERIQSLIMEDHAEADRALSYLKDRGYGRGVFLPLSARPITLSELPSGGGVIGRASDLISVKNDEYKNIVTNLLADAVLVRDMETALHLWKTSSFMTFVTVEGEVLEPSGVLHGGSEKGILSMKGEIRGLDAAMKKAEQTTGNFLALVEKSRHRIEGMESDLEKIERQIREADSELDKLKRQETFAAEALGQNRNKLELMQIERSQAATEFKRLSELRNEKRLLLDGLAGKKGSAEEAIGSLQEEMASNKKLLQRLRDETTDRRVEFNTRKTNLDNLLREKERIEMVVGENQSQQESLRSELTGMGKKMLETDAAIHEASKILSEAVTRVKNETDALHTRKDEFNQRSTDLREIENEVRRIRPQVDAVRSRISELEVSIAKLDLKTENLSKNILDNYGLDIAEVVLSEVPEGADERLRLLREKMTNMGPVSLGSLEEHKELSERYDFLMTQQNDLHQSISSLEEAIFKINRTTKERLTKAYEMLREKFQEVFRALFGGGKADLVLAGEESILEAGLDIVAQPPGKKLQNITLLSGGEKALTAVAMLFAGFLIKPSPLCVLDEVDAPLDESNTDKFVTMLGEMSKNTQFITITHNRRTMESANVLYGVTMEEPGVSKLISMKMADYEE